MRVPSVFHLRQAYQKKSTIWTRMTCSGKHLYQRSRSIYRMLHTYFLLA